MKEPNEMTDEELRLLVACYCFFDPPEGTSPEDDFDWYIENGGAEEAIDQEPDMPDWTSEIADAWELVEMMAAARSLHIWIPGTRLSWHCESGHRIPQKTGTGPTAQRAICEEFIAWKREA